MMTHAPKAQSFFKRNKKISGLGTRMRNTHFMIALLVIGVCLNFGISSAEQTMNLQVVWSHSLVSGVEGWVNTVSISSDGQTLAAGTSKGYIVVYSTDGTFKQSTNMHK